MTTLTEDFNVVEKLAIVRAVDSVILADGTVHQAEISALGRLMHRIDFDSNFILQARNFSGEQVLRVLREMPKSKKVALMGILEEVAISDGFVHEKEAALMDTIFTSMGIGAASNY